MTRKILHSIHEIPGVKSKCHSPPINQLLTTEETSPVSGTFFRLTHLHHLCDPPLWMSFAQNSFKKKGRKHSWHKWMGLHNVKNNNFPDRFDFKYKHLCTYLIFLVKDILVFGSERTSSSVSKEMTSSKTTPRGLDLCGVLTGLTGFATNKK